MKKTFIPIVVIIAGFLAVYGLSNYLDANRTEIPTEIAEADLAFQGATLKRYSLGFDGLIADYYWMSALQYIGRKIEKGGGAMNVSIEDLRPLNPRLLYPLLDTATTLDPDFAAVYSYGATVLPAVDIEQAIKFAEKGIKNQPDNWLTYHQLGFIHWKNNDYKKAAEIYAAGAGKPSAPVWMRQMSAKMQTEGGSRSLAREIYQQLFENAQDQQTKETAAANLLRLDSLDERDAIGAKLQEFQTKNSRCPATWREAFPLFRGARTATGKELRFNADTFAPLDPTDAAYLLVNTDGKCEVALDVKTSKILPDSKTP